MAHEAAPTGPGTPLADPKGTGVTAPMCGDNGAAPAPDASTETIITTAPNN